MKLTREQALKYHRQMWGDMLKALGDKAVGDGSDIRKRSRFKFKWCKEHFGDDYSIWNDCFLCEYIANTSKSGVECSRCPINWGDNNSICPCEGNAITWYESPISEILALPEREVEDGQAH